MNMKTITYRDAINQALAEEMERDPRVFVYGLDVTDHKAVAEAISRIAAKPDPIEILVNNAGIWIDGTLDESPEYFAGLLNTNLVSPFVFMKEVGREMKKNGRGYIFNISSRSGKYGFPGGGLYSS